MLKSKKPPARAQRAREPKKGALVRTTRRPSPVARHRAVPRRPEAPSEKRGIFKAPGGRVWPIPRDCFPRIRHGARHRAVPRRPEAPSENEVFARRLAGECGLYLATVSHDFGTGPVTGQCRGGPRRQAKTRYFQGAWRASVGLYLAIVSHDLGRALTEGSAGDGSAEAPGREESFERPRVVAYAPRGARFPFGFRIATLRARSYETRCPRACRAHRLKRRGEKRSHVLYKIHFFHCLLFRAAGKNRPKGPNAISPTKSRFYWRKLAHPFRSPLPRFEASCLRQLLVV